MTSGTSPARPATRELLLWNVGVAVAYYLAAQAGLAVATIGHQVSPIWPPAGVALAAVLLGGPWVWPGIAFGAFVTNWGIGSPFVAAAVIAAGNTSEAVAGGWFLRRMAFGSTLARLRDVALLVVVAAGAALIAATVGATTLCLAGTRSWWEFSVTWRVWWLGDAMGLLLVTPPILVWSAARLRTTITPRTVEAGLLALILVIEGLLVYGMGFRDAGRLYPFLAFPLLVWASLRFAHQGATAAALGIATFAIHGAYHDVGPFAGPEREVRLALVQLFLAVLATTGLYVASVVAARDRAADRLRAAYRVSRVLARSGEVEQAAPEILRAMCETLGWGAGALWRVDPREGALRCVEVWVAPSIRVPNFENLSRSLVCPRGVGLPGLVWQRGTPLWVEDVTLDAMSPRREAAAADGLRGAFLLPVVFGDDVIGVMEFVSRRVRRPDEDLVELLTTVGGQVGQFLVRKEAESQRRQAEAARRESEELFRLTTDAVPSIVWIAAPDGHIVFVNARWREYCGLTPEDDPNVGIEEQVHPEDRDRRETAWTRALRDGGAYEAELRLRRHDGEYRWFLSRAVPRRDAAGQITFWFGITTDIHRERLLQDQLRDADRRKDEFLATLAHELRNPLAPLSNALQLLRLSGRDGSLREDALVMAERQLRHMVRLLDDLLDVGRITRGTLHVRREQVTLEEVVSRAVETSRPLIDDRGHALEVTLPPDPVTLDVDPTRIAQVVSNLLNNAARYTERGGNIRLVAEVAPAGGDTSAASRVLVLRVIDTGIGLAKDEIERIFEPFVQAERSRSPSHGGMGIGLALVRRLVEAHGGTVEATSEGVGRGSEFVVRLPLKTEAARPKAAAAPAAPAAAAHKQPPRAADGRPLRVLVVDDNRDSTRTMSLLLRRLGHEVATAYDGPDAVTRAQSFDPEVVLLDIGLPTIDGYEVARRVRALPGGAMPFLVALTGWGQDEDRRRSRDAGFDRHLVKPVERDVLEKLLREVQDGGARRGMAEAADPLSASASATRPPANPSKA